MNIKDIAKMANVGVGTVSRVLNNHPNVKESTRKKVMDVINEINYIPNNSARNLKQTKNNSRAIGVLIRGVFNPFFSQMVDTINKKITEAGYTMILRQNDYARSGDDEVRNLIALGKEIRLQGLIYLGCNIDEINEETFKDINEPLVLISGSKSYKKDKVNNFSSVGINQIDSAKMAVDHLIKKGCKKIAIILGTKDESIIDKQRFKGYKKILSENKIEFNKDLIAYGEYTSLGAYEQTKRILSTNNDVDGVFCTSDIMAIGATKAIFDLGLKVGKDVSIVGFDGMDMVKFYNPSITTVVQPRDEMASLGVDILVGLIKNKSEHKHIELKTELFEGDS